MSSKRGRKRNDNLPPNRARDVQRAFRARRAAHLLALEERVSELEEENSTLREMVGWPPDDRPPLGKGPTGKDKPKLEDSGGGSPAVNFFSSHGSESADSSPRTTSSLSPAAVPGSSRDMHVIDSETWEGAYTMNDPNDQQPESPYHLTHTAAPVSTKPLYPSAYGGGLPSSLPPSLSRSPISPAATGSYLSSTAPYSHSSERHLGGSYSSSSFVGRGEITRVESPRQHYSYDTPPSYHNHDAHMHSESPPPSATTSSHPQSHAPLHQRDTASPFTHRRAAAEQYSVNQMHLPPAAQMQAHQSSRPLDQHRVHGGVSEHHQHHLQQEQQQQQQQQHGYRMAYGPDGRII
ncbi:hypothetical protein DXG01_014208 [Tephrocybe rancida]|nr:hypothetical protein DXG01_014208 [Tephrocybe rancida]